MVKWEEARAELRAVLREIDEAQSDKRRRDLRRHYRKLEKEYKSARRYHREAQKKKQEEEKNDAAYID